MGKKKSCTDHLGNSYESIKDMCKHYNIKESTYKSRLVSGFSQEAALTKEVYGRNSTVKDHLGVEYGSYTQMCDAYGISRSLFWHRMHLNGMCIEKSLKPVRRQVKSNLKNGKYIYDHKGNRYTTAREMCKAYGVHENTFSHRIKAGYSIEDALLDTHSFKQKLEETGRRKKKQEVK